MPTGTTKLTQMINPEVMADMVTAKLPKLIKFTPLAYVERKLVGQPGDTITVPKWTYSGDATDVAEGEAIPLDQLTTTKSTMTIKKAAKGFEITDEAILSGLGDPIGQAVHQIALSIANKVDNDILEKAKTATQHITESPTSVDNLQKALDIFEDEDNVNYVLLTNPKDAAKLRKSAAKEWINGSEIGAKTIVNGTFGEVLGVQVVRSKKVDEGKGFLIKVSASQTDTDDVARYGAFVINLKRDVMIEKDRDIVKKATVITADEHYGTYLFNDAFVVKFGE